MDTEDGTVVNFVVRIDAESGTCRPRVTVLPRKENTRGFN